MMELKDESFGSMFQILYDKFVITLRLNTSFDPLIYFWFSIWSFNYKNVFFFKEHCSIINF